jgi:hypothetical protein
MDARDLSVGLLSGLSGGFSSFVETNTSEELMEVSVNLLCGCCGAISGNTRDSVEFIEVSVNLLSGLCGAISADLRGVGATVDANDVSVGLLSGFSGACSIFAGVGLEEESSGLGLNLSHRLPKSDTSFEFFVLAGAISKAETNWLLEGIKSMSWADESENSSSSMRG